MDKGPPEFTVTCQEIGVPSYWVAEVPISGLIHMFRGATESIARRKAEAFIAGERERYYKSLAAVEARRKGRKLGAIRAATEAEKP